MFQTPTLHSSEAQPAGTEALFTSFTNPTDQICTFPTKIFGIFVLKSSPPEVCLLRSGSTAASLSCRMTQFKIMCAYHAHAAVLMFFKNIDQDTIHTPPPKKT